jgi:hypothetical protein
MPGPAVKDGKLDRYSTLSGGVRYGEGDPGPPPSFAAGRFVEYSDVGERTQYGDLGGLVVFMDQDEVWAGNVRYGAGL